MHPTILPPAMVWQLVKKKKNSDFKFAEICLNIDLVSHPVHFIYNWSWKRRIYASV